MAESSLVRPASVSGLGREAGKEQEAKVVYLLHLGCKHGSRKVTRREYFSLSAKAMDREVERKVEQRLEQTLVQWSCQKLHNQSPQP